jgi:phage gp45-like
VIVEAEARAAFLGEVNLTVGEDAVAFESGRLIALAENDAIPVDQTMFDLINDSRGRFLSEVAGTTEVPLDSTFANYDEDTQWGNIITDGFLSRTGAQVAITNAGGIRGGFVIEPGDVTFDDVYTSLPFGNTLVTKEMDGEKLYELLASQAGPLTADFGAEAAIQVSGVTYEYVDRPGVEDPVMEVFVQGEPLRMDRNYTVTVNSFMAGWTFEERYGWNMADLPTVDEDLTLYGTAALEQVQAVSPITEDTAAGDRIRRVTRVAGESAVEVDGDTATLTYEVPDAVGSVEADTFHVDNEVGEELAATDATLSGDSLTVEFDADEFAALEDASDTLELYGTYNDTEFDSQRNGFDQSVLNGEVIEEGSVINVIWGDDRRLSDGELQTAIDYWVSGDPVPGTDGTVVSDRLLSIVIQKWVTAGS